MASINWEDCPQYGLHRRENVLTKLRQKIEKNRERSWVNILVDILGRSFWKGFWNQEAIQKKGNKERVKFMEKIFSIAAMGVSSNNIEIKG